MRRKFFEHVTLSSSTELGNYLSRKCLEGEVKIHWLGRIGENYPDLIVEVAIEDKTQSPPHLTLPVWRRKLMFALAVAINKHAYDGTVDVSDWVNLQKHLAECTEDTIQVQMRWHPEAKP